MHIEGYINRPHDRLRLKIKLLGVPEVFAPQRHGAAAGYDCRAHLGHPDAVLTIKVGEQMMIGLGFAMQLPQGWGAFLLPRSGLGTKQGVVLANTVGLIDEDYRQEVMACIKNTGTKDVVIAHGDRIGQIVLLEVGQFPVEIVDELTETARAGGFGSTGTK